MFWDNEIDSKDEQKFKNFMFINFYGTNEDRDSIMPILVIIVIIGFIVWGIISLFS